MNAAKITISMDAELLQGVDRLVKANVFRNRSQAIQTAVEEKLTRLGKSRLARECAKLDVAEEQAFAELGLASETDLWPTY